MLLDLTTPEPEQVQCNMFNWPLQPVAIWQKWYLAYQGGLLMVYN